MLLGSGRCSACPSGRKAAEDPDLCFNIKSSALLGRDKALTPCVGHFDVRSSEPRRGRASIFDPAFVLELPKAMQLLEIN
jgi:hypothetical protein